MKEEVEDLLEATEKFAGWLDEHGCAGYDPYDIWGTRYGCFARSVYYNKGVVGLPLIAPVLLLEILAPSLRKLFVEKCRYATVDGQLIQAFLNLYRVTDDRSWLDKAIELGEELLDYSIPGYSGYCWGYPFDWQHSKGIYPKDTPFITATPYCYEAYLGLHEATGESRYLEIARSIARFVGDDLRETKTSQRGAAGSYSPVDNTRVINASAYRAMVLLDAGKRFDNQEYRDKGMRNVQFVLETQREDGSWLYEILDDGENSFIDNFHTCFNLKNLVKIGGICEIEGVEKSIQDGYEYYRKELIGSDGLPKYYSIEPRTQIVRLEMYNVAEAITFGALAKDLVPRAFDHAVDLARRLKDDYQLPEGYFITRQYRGGIRHTIPYLRWPQAQLFYSLTNLLVALKDPDSGSALSGSLQESVTN